MKEVSCRTLEGQYAAFCAAHPPRFATVAGHQWIYREAGRGDAPAVVLLPGALGRPETSFEYIDALKPFLRVIAPGYPPTIKTLQAACEGLAGLLTKCGLSRAHIVGGSWGGLIAQAFLSVYPEQVERLVLSDTSPPVLARTLFMRATANVFHLLPDRALRGALGLLIANYVSHIPKPARNFWKVHFDEMIAALTQAEIEGRARIGNEFDSLALDSLPHRDTLILCSASDRNVSPKQFLRLFPQASVHLITSPLGHAASIGDASAYINPIRDFLIERPA